FASRVHLLCFFRFFFFKQKTAYEIGLGIPAEPLFRSFSKLFLMLGSVLVLMLPLLVWLTPDLRIKKSLLKCNWTIRKRLPRCKRSEERRVGKECRKRWSSKSRKEEETEEEAKERGRDK